MSDPADQRLFVINDEQAEALDALLNRPPVFKPRLAELLAEPSIFKQENPDEQ